MTQGRCSTCLHAFRNLILLQPVCYYSKPLARTSLLEWTFCNIPSTVNVNSEAEVVWKLTLLSLETRAGKLNVQCSSVHSYAVTQSLPPNYWRVRALKLEITTPFNWWLIFQEKHVASYIFCVKRCVIILSRSVWCSPIYLILKIYFLFRSIYNKIFQFCSKLCRVKCLSIFWKNILRHK